jgi:hypothetical protein
MKFIALCILLLSFGDLHAMDLSDIHLKSVSLGTFEIENEEQHNSLMASSRDREDEFDKKCKDAFGDNFDFSFVVSRSTINNKKMFRTLFGRRIPGFLPYSAFKKTSYTIVMQAVCSETD